MRKGALVFGALCLFAGIIVSVTLVLMFVSAARPSPSPRVLFGLPSLLPCSAEGDEDAAYGIAGDEIDVPAVDWAEWSRINPHVIGWVSVPGTEVSQPVLRASSDNPTYYLNHDVYGRWNVYGAVFLDAECSAGLFNSPNAVLLGHHMNDGTMLAPLSEYSSQEFASSHPLVVLQDCKHKVVYEVVGVRVIDGTRAEKQVSFATEVSFREWLKNELSCCLVQLRTDIVCDRALELVTCSSGVFEDERTVIHAIPAFIDGRKASPLSCRALLGAVDGYTKDASESSL